MGTVDSYIETVTPPQQTEFKRMRRIIMEAVPTATQGISYGMPAFLYKGKPVISFTVTKKFLSMYPFSGRVVEKLHQKLRDFELTSGSIHFSLGHPIPESLLKEIITTRLQEIEEKITKS